MKETPEGRQAHLRQTQPLILLGMHRSGTSLLVRLLVDLGIHMGSWLSRDAESVHFQRLNRRIYRQTGSKWGQVDGLIDAMRSGAFIKRQAQVLPRWLFERRHPLTRKTVIEGFFGPEAWEEVARQKSFAWGWKDPRTSLTFPIWTHLFPRARYVHVLRNGIDVAISVHRRSIRQRRKLRNYLFPLDYSPATLDFRYSFRLWEIYVSFILDQKHVIPAEQFLEVRYEELLMNPYEQLRRLADFAGHPVRGDLLQAACRRIDRGRLDNSDYAAGYQDEIPALVTTPLMRQLGYSYSGIVSPR
jgi:hypothetical protein